MGRLRIQQCILTLVTRQYGPHPTSDLLGVDYFRTVPADTEFPRAFNLLEVFVRLVGDAPFVGRVRVVVSYLHADGTGRQTVYRKTFPLPSVTTSGPVVVDKGYKLVNLRLPGEGTYAVRVARRARRAWDEKARWRVLAADYFSVRRLP